MQEVRRLAANKTPWHSLTIDDVWSRVKSSPNGLSITETERRLRAYGANELPQGKQTSLFTLFFNQINNILMYVMLVAAGVAFLIEDRQSVIFILVVMFSNVAVGFYQEYKADKSVLALKRLVAYRVRTMRGDREYEVAASSLVPGDVIILRPGDRVPADARLFESEGLQIDESVLTGESRPILKRLEDVSESAGITERSTMIFMGTTVLEGAGRAVIVETGLRTEYGDILRLLQETKEQPTHLQIMMRSLSRTIGLFIGLSTGLIFLIGLLRGWPTSELFVSTLALFVSGVPEGLLPAVTIVLAIGMNRVLRHHGLVRRLGSTETLGGVSVICSDKTGTLTEGKMTVQQIITAEGDTELDVRRPPVDMSHIARRALETAVLSSDAFIENPDGDLSKIKIRGRPTDQSLVQAGAAMGIWKHDLEATQRSIATVFFSSDRKYSASLREHDGEYVLHVMGAPERILDRATRIETAHGPAPLKSREAERVLSRFTTLRDEGYRILACAYRDAQASNTEHIEESIDDLTLLGLIVLDDPVRLEVPQALRETAQAGIRTVIVTGDHAQTARAVAAKIGFQISDDQILLGDEIEAMSDAELREKISVVSLYARVTPRHKLRIVQAFQARGEVVAVFGDGINDTPALKAADVGVAVGTEVDAVRETADLVLLESGFHTVVDAVRQGRIIFNNVRRVFMYLLMIDLSQFVIYFVSIAAGLPLPMIAAQVLFINFIESSLPDIGLAVEHEEDDIMREKPRKKNESVASRSVLFVLASTLVITGTVATCFYLTISQFSGSIELTRTMMTALLCIDSLLLSLSLRSFNKPLFRHDMFDNKFLSIAVATLTAILISATLFDPLRSLTSLVPISPLGWTVIILVAVFEILLIDECKQFFLSRKKARQDIMKSPTFAIR